MSNLIKAALIRALYTICESLSSNLPIGCIITPVMIQTFDWSILYVIAAWLGTALLAGFIAFFRAITRGLPEVDLMEEEDYDEEEFDDEDE